MIKKGCNYQLNIYFIYLFLISFLQLLIQFNIHILLISYMNFKAIIKQIFKPHISSSISIDTYDKHPMFKMGMNNQHSAVTIILKISDKFQYNNHQFNQNIQASSSQLFRSTKVLLLKRVKSQKLYSGQICLPGGKMDNGQTIMECAERQTEEETGIILKSQQKIGVLKQRFLAYQTGDRQLFVYTVLFVIDYEPDIRLSVDEIESYRWVSLSQLLNSQNYQPFRVDNNKSSPFFKIEALQHAKHFQYFSVNVQMGQNIYGLTLFVLSYFLQKFYPFLKTLLHKSYQQEQKEQFFNERRKQTLQFREQIRSMIYQINYFKSVHFWKIRIVANQGVNEEDKKRLQIQFDQFMILFFPKQPKL